MIPCTKGFLEFRWLEGSVFHVFFEFLRGVAAWAGVWLVRWRNGLMYHAAYCTYGNGPVMDDWTCISYIQSLRSRRPLSKLLDGGWKEHAWIDMSDGCESMLRGYIWYPVLSSSTNSKISHNGKCWILNVIQLNLYQGADAASVKIYWYQMTRYFKNM